MAQSTKAPYGSKRTATPAAKRLLSSGGYFTGGACGGTGRLEKADHIAGRKGAKRFARGGRAKGKTEIHIHVGRPQMPGAPAMPMGAPPAMPHPPMAGPPMPPMAGPPMMGAPGAMPPPGPGMPGLPPR